MKLTADTRINAVMLCEKDKDVILYSRDKNMTLGEFIFNTMVRLEVIYDKAPDPIEILDFDFEIGQVEINSYGHRFTLLKYRTEKKSCVINKLDLAGSY